MTSQNLVPSIQYQPVLFRLHQADNKHQFHELVDGNPEIRIYDAIEQQLRELMRISSPQQVLTVQQQDSMAAEHIKGCPLEEYGVWVYYPWNRNLVHILDEEEFVALRTNRNMYKIEPREFDLLRRKKIGVIGLSVGQSIALTIAMERICGEIRLADFDEVELSNMNRIRVGIQDLGLNKAVVAARQIAELDPFIKVVCYIDGVHGGNMDDFFGKDGKIDVLVEECDGIDVKVLSRIKARSFGVPVVMDTNDRGMVDVERFDVEGNRPILHGAVEDLEALPIEEVAERLKGLSLEEKVHYLSKIIGMQNVSGAMLKSLGELNKTIVGWPQLASAVVLGGAMVTDVCRRILLDKHMSSGRYFVDFDELLSRSSTH